MNYEEHVLAGIVTYPVAIFVASILQHYAHVPFELTPAGMLLGYAFYVLGSDLPDMDHPNGLIHRGTKPIFAVLVGSTAYLRLGPLIEVSELSWLNLTLAWVIAAIIGFGSWYLFTALMPSHRGIVHSLVFAIVYGALSALTVVYGIGLSIGQGTFVGLSAFLGYVLHLLLDREIKVV